MNGINASARFILLSAGIDMTVPRSFFNYGPKMRGFSGDMSSYWGRILNDPRVIHWYCENHDLNHPKLSTLPTGERNIDALHKHPTDFLFPLTIRTAAFVSNGRDSLDDFSDHPDRSSVLPIEKRPLKFIVSDKVR